MISQVAGLPATAGAVVLRMTLTDRRRLVLKVTDGSDATVDFERTETVIALARAAGVPTPAVLVADNTGYAGRRYLLREHVHGVPWRHVRPELDPRQVAAAHQQIAEAVLSLQSVRLRSFGELDRNGQPAGQNLLDALRSRAELRVADGRARDSSPCCWTGTRNCSRVRRCRRCVTTTCTTATSSSAIGREAGSWPDWSTGTRRRPGPPSPTSPEWGSGRHDRAGVLAGVPRRRAHHRRAGRSSLIYQLLWCFEYRDGSPRHAAATAALKAGSVWSSHGLGPMTRWASSAFTSLEMSLRSGIDIQSHQARESS